MTRKDQLGLSLKKAEDAIAEACRKAGRPRHDVMLLAVSKFHPVQDIRALAQFGQMSFGENYLQEAESKMQVLPDLDWHMIGHVQKKKAAHMAGRFSLIHSLDSQELANGLEAQLGRLEKRQDVLIQVNVGREAQKSGVVPERLLPLADHVLTKCPHLQLKGLMCLPPVQDGNARQWFAFLRTLRDQLRKDLGVELSHLSMGMSGDFPEAIAEGATIIRLGTRLFGPRSAN